MSDRLLDPEPAAALIRDRREPPWLAVRLDVPDCGIHVAGAELAERPHRFGGTFGMVQIVGRTHDDDIALDLRIEPVEMRVEARHAALLGVGAMQHANRVRAGVIASYPLDNFGRAVIRALVAEHQFHRAISLRQDRFDRRRDVALLVPAGDDERDPHGASRPGDGSQLGQSGGEIPAHGLGQFFLEG